MCRKVQRPNILGREVRLKVKAIENNGNGLELEEINKLNSQATHDPKHLVTYGVNHAVQKFEMVEIIKHSGTIGGNIDNSDDDNFALSM